MLPRSSSNVSSSSPLSSCIAFSFGFVSDSLVRQSFVTRPFYVLILLLPTTFYFLSICMHFGIVFMSSSVISRVSFPASYKLYLWIMYSVFNFLCHYSLHVVFPCHTIIQWQLRFCKIYRTPRLVGLPFLPFLRQSLKYYLLSFFLFHPYTPVSVSYTHLDVYKRQPKKRWTVNRNRALKPKTVKKMIMARKWVI